MLSLVIPCYNESPNLELLAIKCERLVKDLIEAGIETEIILVNNGSTDSSEQKLRSLAGQFHFIRPISLDKNAGYGGGLLAGLAAAKGEIIAWTHADLQANPSDILPAIELFKTSENKNLFIKGKRKGRPLMDRLFTFGMTITSSALLRETLTDVNGQPTIFKREFLDTWEDPPKDFSLDLYTFYHAKVKGLKIQRIPVIFERRKYGSSSWNDGLRSRLKLSIATIRFVLQLRRKQKCK